MVDGQLPTTNSELAYIPLVLTGSVAQMRCTYTNGRLLHRAYQIRAVSEITSL